MFILVKLKVAIYFNSLEHFQAITWKNPKEWLPQDKLFEIYMFLVKCWNVGTNSKTRSFNVNTAGKRFFRVFLRQKDYEFISSRTFFSTFWVVFWFLSRDFFQFSVLIRHDLIYRVSYNLKWNLIIFFQHHKKGFCE